MKGNCRVVTLARTDMAHSADLPTQQAKIPMWIQLSRTDAEQSVDPWMS